MIHTLVPMLVAVVPVILFGLLIEAVRRGEETRQRRDPFVSEFLRPAGYGRQRTVDTLQLDLALTFGFGLALPLWFYSVWLTLGKNTLGPSWTGWLYAGLGLASFVYFLIRTVVIYRGLSRTRLDLDGEAASGQEFDRLMRAGARVFHDMPGNGSNIHHIVVGATGVLAVESMAHPRPERQRGTADASVSFDGRQLRFPDHREEEAVRRARDNARWLGDWLSAALNEPIEVRPVLALPGWIVERQGLSDVTVLNPRDCARHLQGQPKLSEKMQERVAFQIERACRNERPDKRRRRR
ncbi:MAG: hypothetical protein WBN78_01845 [Gammaproteobacteria bacterium]